MYAITTTYAGTIKGVGLFSVELPWVTYDMKDNPTKDDVAEEYVERVVDILLSISNDVDEKLVNASKLPTFSNKNYKDDIDLIYEVYITGNYPFDEANVKEDFKLQCGEKMRAKVDKLEYGKDDYQVFLVSPTEYRTIFNYKRIKDIPDGEIKDIMVLVKGDSIPVLKSAFKVVNGLIKRKDIKSKAELFVIFNEYVAKIKRYLLGTRSKKSLLTEHSLKLISTINDPPKLVLKNKAFLNGDLENFTVLNIGGFSNLYDYLVYFKQVPGEYNETMKHYIKFLADTKARDFGTYVRLYSNKSLLGGCKSCNQK